MIYVVMPHYIINDKVAEFAKNAIASFKRTANCKIISCDDASPYDTSFLKDISDIYIRNEKNKGFAGNVNVGFIKALEFDDCEWIVCANNDIEVYPQWFERFKQALDIANGDMVGGLGYKVKEIEGRPIGDYDKNPGSRFANNYLSEGGRLDDWVFPGGFWMMKRNVLEDIGLLDEAFQHGGYEDIDFFYRVKQAGKRLIMTPKVAYWHFEGATRFSEQEKPMQNNVEPLNRAYFKQKHGFDAHLKMNTYLIDNRINL